MLKHNFLPRALVALLAGGAMTAVTAFDAAAQGQSVSLTVRTDEATHQIDEKVYGHFLEHIYHSVNSGLWGDLIWNRSFELTGEGMGVWSIEGDAVVQSALVNDTQQFFGDAGWQDYEITLQARKQSGAEGFMVVFRAVDSDNFYWLNLGGWGNTEHAIEKEVNGNRIVIGQRRQGRIENNRWYDIRVRCEGNRFQCWVDGELIADVTDNNPYRQGRIGLGTWGTRAEYRNIQVRSLAGDVLFEGLPEIEAPQVRLSFWDVPAQAAIVGEALNNEKAVQVTTEAAGPVLVQHNFGIKRQPYIGSLWMKGTAADGVLVELLDGDNVLASATLPAPTGEWAEYPFTLTPSAETGNGSLRISLRGAGTVTFDQISMMGQDAIDAGGFRPDLLEAVRALRPPIIRWPGGCFASLYFWKDAIGPQHMRKIYSAYMWDDQDINSYGTDEFLRMCEEIGAEPLLVVNTGVLDSACGAPAQWKLTDEEYLPYALEWMEYVNGDVTTPMGALRAANGHPEPYNVRFWEIDNETWAAGSAAYIEKVKEFVPAMRKKAEELGVPIEVIVCGGNRFDMSWNLDLLNSCAELIDYISVHNYEDPDNFGSGVRRYEDFLVELAGHIALSANPQMKIYNSEWNAQSTDWRTGLYAGGILNAYERQGEFFKIGGPALFLRHVTATGWDNAFINFDQNGWFPAPNYVVMKLWYDHFAPNFLALSGETAGTNIVATRSEDGATVYLKAVNPERQLRTVSVELEGDFEPGEASMLLVAPGSVNARNTLEQPERVKAEPAEVTLSGRTVTFALPALSAGVVTVSAK